MKHRLTFISALAIGAGILAHTPAQAGTCPAGSTAANPLADAPTMPLKVTDDVIGSVDLEKEMKVAGNDLRLRRLVVQPGGIVPLHSHVGRPAIITIVSGTVVENRSSCAVGITHRAGDVVSEAGGISHWWKNMGKTPAVLLSADVKAR